MKKKMFHWKVNGLKGVGVGYKLIVKMGDLLSDISQVWSLMDTGLGGAFLARLR